MQNKYLKLLNDIVKNYPQSYQRILKKKENTLLQWINNNTTKLDGICNLNTRIYWLLHNITDFPCCATCGKQLTVNVITIKQGYTRRKDKENLYCCSSCAQKSKHAKENKASTKLNHFGDKNFNNREKTKITMIKKYGTDNNMKSEKGKQEYLVAIRKKYNDENITSPMQVQEVKDKAQKSFKEFKKSARYIEYKKKQIQFWKDLSKDQIKLRTEKIRQTYYKKTGYYWVSQNPNIDLSSHKYKYDDIKFDSFPELCYYCWLKSRQIEFTYKPKIRLVYTYANKIHYYKPDFIINGKIVEIKGDQFFKSDGTMQNPFNHKLDPLYEAKHQCMLANNVKILKSKDYQKYIDWCLSNIKDIKDYKA